LLIQPARHLTANCLGCRHQILVRKPESTNWLKPEALPPHMNPAAAKNHDVGD
jgi:hypothetical protein